MSSIPYGIVVVASSAGGIEALLELLAPLPAGFPLPVAVVQHLPPEFRSQLPSVLGRGTRLSAEWAEPGERPRAGCVHVAPPGLHLALAEGGRFVLHTSAGPSRYRPDANLLFGSAARAYGERAIGIVLSRMLDDGTRGIAEIAAAGGITMAQSESSAQFFDMPAAAIDFGRADLVAAPARMADYLQVLASDGPARAA